MVSDRKISSLSQRTSNSAGVSAAQARRFRDPRANLFAIDHDVVEHPLGGRPNRSVERRRGDSQADVGGVVEGLDGAHSVRFLAVRGFHAAAPPARSRPGPTAPDPAGRRGFVENTSRCVPAGTAAARIIRLARRQSPAPAVDRQRPAGIVGVRKHDQARRLRAGPSIRRGPVRCDRMSRPRAGGAGSSRSRRSDFGSSASIQATCRGSSSGPAGDLPELIGLVHDATSASRGPPRVFGAGPERLADVGLVDDPGTRDRRPGCGRPASPGVPATAPDRIPRPRGIDGWTSSTNAAMARWGGLRNRRHARAGGSSGRPRQIKGATGEIRPSRRPPRLHACGRIRRRA